jgi:IS1 family transposase
VGKKQRNMQHGDSPELGDAWVFVALHADSKLIPAYTVGKRNRETTYKFLNSLKNRIAEEHRFQLTTDGFHFYRSPTTACRMALSRMPENALPAWHGFEPI